MNAEVSAAANAQGAGPGAAEPVRTQRVAAYGLVTDGERILLTRLTVRTTRPGAWTLPGGGIDHGEHPRDAVVRELHEETGLPATVGEVLDVDSSHFVGVAPHGVLEDYHVVRILYRVDVPADREPVVTEVDGTTDLACWFPLDEAAELPMTEFARRGVRRALALAGQPTPDQP